MFNPFRILEQILYKIRDAFWSYPDLLFAREDSVRYYFNRVYNASIPYSHFAASFVVSVFIIFIVSFDIIGIFSSNVLSAFGLNLVRDSNTMYEGVIMGVDPVTGNAQKLTKVNPIVPSNIQLEKDLVELIYEPLVRYEYSQNENGDWITRVRPILADEVIELRQGADYQFRLKRSVKWHDGAGFTADDVIRTFELYSTLDISNAYVQAIKQLKWEKVDEYTVRICTKNDASDSALCNESKNSPILSNFLELIGVKIIPLHLSENLNASTVLTSDIRLFRSPVGTGQYKFKGATDRTVTLELFDDYYQDYDNDIKRIEFIFFKDLDSSITALQSGEIHSFSSISVEYLNELKKYPNINSYYSPVLDTQYWALYFNLRKDLNGNPIAPDFLSDVNIRKAVSLAIDRSALVDKALSGVGEESFGTISKRSYFFNPYSLWYGSEREKVKEILNAEKWKFDSNKTLSENAQDAYTLLERNGMTIGSSEGLFTHNVNLANDILEKAGWTLKKGDKYRTNDAGVELKFNFYYVDSYDRANVARIIKQDLERIGVNAVIDRRQQPGQDSSENGPSGWSLEELNNQVLAPRSFDVILYGMNTFIDPDRYELFHSSQQLHPGLNIAGYVGTAETVKPRENRQEGESSLVRVSKVDRLLEQTRGFDPDEARDDRKENYDIVQELISDDSPVVFLYHPRFIYYFNNRVENVNLTGVASIEDRFRNIKEWEVE